MRAERVAVIGAGVGGLTAALLLAAQGLDVTVLERGTAPGGKMREVAIGAARIDAGPTVLTMRGIFDEIFEAAGTRLDGHVKLHKAEILARHAWGDGGRLDLSADIECSAEAIAAFAGPGDARGYKEFCARARRVFETLDEPFMRRPAPSLPGLVSGVGVGRVGDLLAISPFTTLWKALGEHFRDARLRQLFARYATYCGSSPFEAPATLMLVAHVEQAGVWLVEGGMHRLAQALADLASVKGARLRYGADVGRILMGGGRTAGIELADGERIEADAVVCNGDFSALGRGRLGDGARRAAAPLPTAQRSLSALTWSLVAPTRGFPLVRHNVFFSDDYRSEFDDIFKRRRLPRTPTVYLCAQDRDDTGGLGGAGRPERLFLLVNAPPSGDAGFDAEEIAPCLERALGLLTRCGLDLQTEPASTVATSPLDFARMFPATGGALYGPASHGWTASFRRPGCRTKLPGLYLAGGSIHPGPGVPMAALSGRMAAASLLEDLARRARASTYPSRRMGTRGGTSTV